MHPRLFCWLSTGSILTFVGIPTGLLGLILGVWPLGLGLLVAGCGDCICDDGLSPSDAAGCAG
jgi:hypothetical protein